MTKILSRLSPMLLALPLMLVTAHASAQAWRPTKPIEIVVGSAPGSGADVTARTMQQILQTEKIVNVPVIVVNKPGANAVVAMQYLGQADGDAHRVLLQASTAILSSAAGTFPMDYFEFTPIARLISEPIIVLVRADSQIKDGGDLAARIKANPGAVSVGQATSLGSAFHVAAAQFTKGVGADPRKLLVVPYQSSAQALNALVGGTIDTAWVTPGTVQSLVEANKVRAVAIAADQRMSGAFSAVPTFKELGTHTDVDYWRGVIGGRNMKPEQLAYWQAALGRMVKTQAWQDSLAKNLWVNSYLAGAPLVKTQRAEFESMRSTLGELGLAK